MSVFYKKKQKKFGIVKENDYICAQNMLKTKTRYEESCRYCAFTQRA